MNKQKKDLAVRMKEYEACYDIRIPKRTYTILRLDGKGFSKYTKRFNKPFDDILSNAMEVATIELCKYLNPKFAYHQSDEISLLFTDIENIESELIFDGKVQKLCSISASKVTSAFNKIMLRLLSTFKYDPKTLLEKINLGDFQEIDAVFDSRVFIIPDPIEVSNYFIWRQKDCIRNSVSMAASANFSHKSLEGLSNEEKKIKLLDEKEIIWDNYLPKYKQGTIVRKQVLFLDGINGETVNRNKWLPDYNTPVFVDNKEYLTKLIPLR